MRTIQGKILTVIILAFLTLALTLSILSVFVIKNVLHNDAEKLIETRAREEAAYINDILGRIEESVYIVETYAEDHIESAKRLGKDAAYREAYTTELGELFYNVSKNTDGVEAFYVRYDPYLTHSVAGFFVKTDGAGSFISLTPTDLFAYSPDDVEHVGWYYQPIEAGESIWMAEYTNKNIGVDMISFVTPLEYTNPNGEKEVFGVCGIDVNFNHFTNVIDSLTVYETGFAYLADANGEVLHYPDRGDKEAINKADRIEASAPMDNNMHLVIRADHSAVEKDTPRFIITVIAVTLFLLTIFIVISNIIIRNMTRPLKQLAHAAEELANGNADVRCNCTTNDEIGRLAVIFNDTSAKLKDYMGYINSLAYRDSLTGVKNRTAFIEAISSLNTKLRAHQTSFGILMADINGLKRANDLYGHDVGNRLIVEAIKVVCNVFKHSPVFRIGGDEFAVILEGQDLQNYKSLLRELEVAYLKTYVSLDNEKLPIMMAYGVAVFTAGLDRDVDDVINRADQQMYAHKRDFKRRNGE